MDAKRLRHDPQIYVALLTFLCFFLGSTGWLLWLYHLTSLADPASVDVLTMVVGYLMQAVGLGAFAFVQRTQKAPALRHTVFAALIAYVVCIAPAALAPDLATTLALGYLANVLCGFVQGYYLLCLAQDVPADRRGLVFGSAYALSTLASWIWSSVGSGMLTGGFGGIVCCLVVAGCAAAVVRIPAPSCATPDDLTPGAVPDHGLATDRHLVALASATVVLMSLVKNAGFGFPATDILEGVSLELSRLVYGVGLLVAGAVSDKDRRYGAVCCAAALVTPFLMLSLSGAAAPATLMWALNYLLFGFFSVYRVLVFADLASDGQKFLLAGFGLLFGRVGDALGTALYVTLASHTLVLIAANSALFACAIGLLMALGQRLYTRTEETPPSPEELFERFAVRHDLSVREREVLQQVLGHRSNSEIAGALFVSEATVKFHVRNLLRKTGCKNRRELMDLYTASNQHR